MMTRFLDFIKSRTGMSLCFGAVVLILFYFIGEFRERSGRETLAAPVLPRLPLIGGARGEADELGENTILEARRDYSPFRPATSEPEEVKTVPLPTRRQATEVFVPMSSLVHTYHPIERSPVSKVIPTRANPMPLPVGTMIQCRLINTIDSGALESPLIAKVLEPVMKNGRVLVPRGAEIHGRVKKGNHRDRIETRTSWQLLLPSGKAIRITGIGLNRDHDRSKDQYGVSDGSIGLEGREIKPGPAADYKRFAATGIAAFGRFSQRRARTIYGEEALVNVRNGVLEGGSAVVDRYADQMKKEAEDIRPFVRVPAGKEFYVYVTAEVPRVSEVAGEADSAGLQNVLQQRQNLMNKLRSQLSESRK